MVPWYIDLTDEGLVIHRVWGKLEVFSRTLNGSASIFQLKHSMNFLHSIILTVKTGSGFYSLNTRRLEVSKTDPVLVV